MKTVGIIPARMNSSRFPGKPMEKILGMPMIGHVWARTKMCSILDEVFVATCDQEIKEYIESIGGKAIMTSMAHERCTERTVEAILKIEQLNRCTIQYVVMIQGDEPMVLPNMVEESISPLLASKEISVVNLMAKISNESEALDPNTVKVVCDAHQNALYFSREPIPSRKKLSHTPQYYGYKQVCVISFEKNFLLTFNELHSTPLEIIESIDMLRLLEYGHNIRMVETFQLTQAVDTKEDRDKVEKLMENDALLKKYLY